MSDTKQAQAEEAREAISNVQESIGHGLEEAKKLVERTRALLTGEAPYDEDEANMSALWVKTHPDAPGPEPAGG